jgi:hypothetical protein
MIKRIKITHFSLVPLTSLDNPQCRCVIAQRFIAPTPVGTLTARLMATLPAAGVAR